MSGYYLPRWRLFVQQLAVAVREGKQWDQAAYNKEKRATEQQWQHSKEKYPVTAQGDTLMYAQYVTTKYKGGRLLRGLCVNCQAGVR